MEYDEAIQQCSSLMSFEIDICRNVRDVWNPGYYKRYDVLSMQPHLKLKKLVAATELYQDTSDYIMHKFPNLECCNVKLSLDEEHIHSLGPWLTRVYAEKLREFQKYRRSRRCDLLYIYGTIPLIEGCLHSTTNHVIRISFPEIDSSLLHIQHDNTTWVIRNTTERLDKLKELFRRQNVIKEALLNMYNNSEDSPLVHILLSGCTELEKFTYKKDVMRFSQTEFPDAGQPEILSACSHALPELHNLVIENDCEISDPTLFVIDMYRTRFDHLQVDLFTALCFPTRSEETFDQPVLLEAMAQKSGAKQFLASFVSSNQIEEFTGDKEYAWKFVINCASIDFISIKINKTRILKNYPLFL
ncbi:hypothetical protein BCV71DRAFT_235790 [Rhizopus microsporus]|uniref:Uncharacterized protein n=1 Tax=Rhizopus microsporus TaxID=58291 RepID=A0A1X0RZL9_RHIZD|nr:hypothetical protein BCV71DRAFT_235790 [Rhizopus microsporus]